VKSFSSRAYPELEGFRTKDSGLERLVTAKKARHTILGKSCPFQGPRSKIQGLERSRFLDFRDNLEEPRLLLDVGFTDPGS
tara:strand:- start:148 stop:390 length:243 start_codon:yes stop_codon:yes gene_type:complete